VTSLLLDRRAARRPAALLAGHLDTPAVAIEGKLEALYDAGRDRAGRLDPAEVMADLVAMHHQDVTVSPDRRPAYRTFRRDTRRCWPVRSARLSNPGRTAPR
jgi:hypothetical protein